MEMWWVGPDVAIHGAWAYAIQDWHRYEPEPRYSGAVVAGIRAQARLPNFLNLWWITPTGAAEGVLKVIGPGQKWTRYQIAANGSASLSSGLFSLHRQHRGNVLDRTRRNHHGRILVRKI